MRVGSLRLVLRVVFLALAASLLLAAGAPAASSPDYRCCFRLDALMTGRLDTVYDDLPGKPSDDERATFTFMTSELLVYSITGARPQLRRASTRRGGPWPQTDGPGVAFGVGRVTTHTGGRVACDVEDSSRVYTSAPNLMNRIYRGAQGLHLRVEVGQGVADIGGKADRACDETQHGVRTGPLDGLSAGGPTSHLLVPPTRAQFATFKAKKLSRVRRFGRDVKHNPILSTLIPHKTTGFVRVEVCIRYVGPQRVKSEAAKIRSLIGKEPTRVSSLRCS
jgi:hypothetical protein